MIKKSNQLEQLNNWQDWKLSDQTITFDQLLLQENLTDVDFIKIDVDGNDMDILNSAKNVIKNSPVLGIIMEVNFYGGVEDLSNTFHNVDKTMRSLGFDLFELSHRTYTVSALPGPFKHNAFAQSSMGRIYQGDAIYLRDPLAKMYEINRPPQCPELSVPKLIKLVCLFELMGLPDHSAELLLKYQEVLSPHVDVEKCLNILTRELTCTNQTYKEYMSLVVNNPKILYPDYDPEGDI
jgi:hypothetical protein